ncbi:MAG: sucrase ferredoxin, partial [Actinomycetota bacterium]|nr:sucrase ferredoxin [Actinomycetota bacterium]
PPGPWGSEALLQSRLPDAVATELAVRARQDRVRVLLLRRPDRPETAERHCYVVFSGRPATSIEHRLITDPRELLDLDLSPLRRGGPVGFGEPWDEPLYLVCTNGRHDPCCAQLGRPVIRALLDQPTAWECSHVGGDRFAGNLVCMPHGLYFGRVGPDSAVRVVDAYAQGTIDLDHYRGRAGDPFPVQAAEYFLRRAERILSVDDLVPGARRRLGDNLVEVDFAGPDGHYSVQVGLRSARPPRPLTCAAISQERPPEYFLVSLRAG